MNKCVFKPKNLEIKRPQYDFPFVFIVFFKKTQYIFFESKTIFYEFFENLHLKLPLMV